MLGMENINLRKNYLRLLSLLLIGFYILNCFGPLRLTNDTVRYLNIKTWMDVGSPANGIEAKEFLPHGYIWFLILLDKLHIAKSFFISFFQLGYLLGGLWFVKKMFGKSLNGWSFLFYCLLSWGLLKLVITPLSEMQFLFFSMGALYFFNAAEENKKGMDLFFAFLFSTMAIFTRTVGIVLIGSFLLTFLFRHRKNLWRSMLENKWMAISIFVFLVLLCSLAAQFGIAGYFDYHYKNFTLDPNHGLSYFARTIGLQFINWSDVFLNFPAPKLDPSQTYTSWLAYVYLLIGLAGFFILLYILFVRVSAIPLVVKYFLVLYSVIIFNWPFIEPRFWAILLPVSVAVFMQGKAIVSGFSRILILSYRAIYIVAGIASLLYYSYTSLNKQALSLKQDAGQWKNEYQTYFYGKPLSDSAAHVREPIVDLLKKYD